MATAYTSQIGRTFAHKVPGRPVPLRADRIGRRETPLPAEHRPQRSPRYAEYLRYTCIDHYIRQVGRTRLTCKEFSAQSADLDTAAVTALDIGYVGQLIEFN
jgi:hypothetical protein